MTLKELQIHNIVLIESATIPFHPGFTVISGETGSGKSALLAALGLINGERADSDLIRHGADRASVTALFDIEALPHLAILLINAGIEHGESEPLILRREIALSGKGRVFINNQAVQLTLLRSLTPHLFNQVSQHANRQLLAIEEHRSLLDFYADLEPDVTLFAKSWEAENQCKQQLGALIQTSAERLRQIESCHREIEELQEAHLKEGEEEELFAAYTRLTHIDELTSYLNSLIELLTHERQGVIPLLLRHRATLEKVTLLDNLLQESAGAFQNVTLELQEVAYALEKGLSRCESQPEKTEEINSRLSSINRLKRKYGATVAEMQDYLEKAEIKLAELENSDDKIENLKKELAAHQIKNSELARQISRKRAEAAKKLIIELTPHLRGLNMAKVEFAIDITAQPRSASGDDKIEFFLLPNIGEKRLAVKDFASGGELSRLMLCLQTILAGKRAIPTLLFDEIDANIGGTTAAIVGEKLRQIGTKHQVIAITHFPQVAQHADLHLMIAKQEKEGRTVTEVTPLHDTLKRAQEMARLSGQ